MKFFCEDVLKCKREGHLKYCWGHAPHKIKCGMVDREFNLSEFELRMKLAIKRKHIGGTDNGLYDQT